MEKKFCFETTKFDLDFINHLKKHVKEKILKKIFKHFFLIYMENLSIRDYYLSKAE